MSTKTYNVEVYAVFQCLISGNKTLTKNGYGVGHWRCNEEWKARAALARVGGAP